MVVFARHDVTRDPPFARVDLVSCRNLLIYMSADLQQRLFPLFHFALNEGGYLFLGTSETVGDAQDLFAVVDRKWKIFRRKKSTRRRTPATVVTLPPGAPAHRGKAEGEPAVVKSSSVRSLVEHMLLEDHVPAAVMINAGADVLYVHGRAGSYLEPPRGEATSNVLRMAREGLELPLCQRHPRVPRLASSTHAARACACARTATR